jgi:DeoR family transcriptional regulator, fructose operon transcriptional repressor
MRDNDSSPPPVPDRDTAPGALPPLRQNRVLEILQERGQVTVNDLVALFEVSQDTIRRDLDVMERRGLLVRTHGGAVHKDQMVRVDTTLSLRLSAHAEAKRRIARAAVRLVRDGETLLLNGGSSTCAFAEALGEHRGLTIVTNNFRIPPVTPEAAAQMVYILGGTYWPVQQVTIGPVVMPGLAGFEVDTAVIGVTAISAAGITMGRLDEAAETASMVALARRTIVVADQSKFNSSAFALIATFDRIDYLVTDAQPPGELAEVLGQAGVRIVVAKD